MAQFFQIFFGVREDGEGIDILVGYDAWAVRPWQNRDVFWTYSMLYKVHCLEIERLCEFLHDTWRKIPGLGEIATIREFNRLLWHWLRKNSVTGFTALCTLAWCDQRSSSPQCMEEMSLPQDIDLRSCLEQVLAFIEAQGALEEPHPSGNFQPYRGWFVQCPSRSLTI